MSLEFMTVLMNHLIFHLKLNPNLKSNPVKISVSPCKVADTRSKYITQLHDIKSLVEGGVLTDKEYTEQKEIILSSLRKLK